MDIQVGGGGTRGWSSNLDKTYRFSYDSGFVVQTPDIENGTVEVVPKNNQHTRIFLNFPFFENYLNYSKSHSNAKKNSKKRGSKEYL